MRLLIISHTAHYRTSDGEIVGWGPTITEINHLAAHFDRICHLAPLHKGSAPRSSLPYMGSNIIHVPLKRTGGTGIWNKFKILFYAPLTLYKTFKLLKKVDAFQFRAPTGIGMYLIPALTWFSNRKGWFKYAGNWQQEDALFSFRTQRNWLIRQERKVTINGRWKDQPSHCISFDNPCLDEADRKVGRATVEKKSFPKKYNICYVGAFYRRKGVGILLDSLKSIETDRIDTVYLVGAGGERDYYSEVIEKARELPHKIEFTGFLPREEIFEVYKRSHFIVLPSMSEGFPKVISEAMNFGCIPLVTDISCMIQYIEDKKNGFFIHPKDPEVLAGVLKRCFDLDKEVLRRVIHYNYTLAERFTYRKYFEHLKQAIIDD